MTTPSEYFFSRSKLRSEPKGKRKNNTGEHDDIIAPKGRKRQRL